MDIDYQSVTELANEEVSREQVERLCTRYVWATPYCSGKDVLEAACGAGQGLGYLAKIVGTIKGGDISEPILECARKHYGDRVDLRQFDAMAMPFDSSSLDVIILFEALYYIPSAEKFLKECRRILRPNGKILISTANPDLYDFNPSPHSFEYFGVLGLKELFLRYGFSTEFFVGTPLEKVSLRQKILRPVKKVAVSAGLMPKTMRGKKLLKRIVFGELVSMPPEITEETATYVAPTHFSANEKNVTHKVIYCVASMEA